MTAAVKSLAIGGKPASTSILRQQNVRTFDTYIGIDLGGARGKTTAVARLSAENDCSVVEEAAPRCNGQPWNDQAIIDYLVQHRERGPTVVAISAPLTSPACVRCTVPVCPGVAVCAVESVVWLQTCGTRLMSEAREAAAGASIALRGPPRRDAPLVPYVHRCTEVELHFGRNHLPREVVGQGLGPRSARGVHLRRQLARVGFTLNDDLVEVSPRATVSAVFGNAVGRGYKRDADPWMTRAKVLDGLPVRFGPRSRFAREGVLANDNCFEALLAGITAFMRSRDQWEMPADGPWQDDGFIWSPPI